MLPTRIRFEEITHMDGDSSIGAHSDGNLPQKTTTVVLAYDHGFVRVTIRGLLEAERGFQVVGETSNGLDAAQMLETLRPTVAVVDITMPGMDGLELARKTCESSLNTSVVIYSLYESKAYVLEAMRAGAKACVSKTSSLNELVLAIRQVAAGGRTSAARSRTRQEAVPKEDEDTGGITPKSDIETAGSDESYFRVRHFPGCTR
jgi:DNA-binding NarL/FixJ family response regulator